MSTVRAIANRMQVSVATVSRALNNHPEISAETRDRVLKAANEVGYQSSIGKRVMTNIALAYTSQIRFTDFDGLILAGMLRGVTEQGFSVTILQIESEKAENETYTQLFMRKGIRGAVLRTMSHSRTVCEAIAHEDFPAVVVAERFDDEKVNYIYSKSGVESRRAIEHLLHLGHRRIAFVMNYREDADHHDRLLAYRAALTAAGIEVDDDLILALPASFESGKVSLNRLLSLPAPPTAIFFADPLPCHGALARAHELGISVPEQLSLIGCDDGQMRTRTWPEMSAVCQDATALGFEAALWLTRRLALAGSEQTKSKVGTGPALRKALNSFFEVRGTTGPLPSRVIRALPDGSKSFA